MTSALMLDRSIVGKPAAKVVVETSPPVEFVLADVDCGAVCYMRVNNEKEPQSVVQCHSLHWCLHPLTSGCCSPRSVYVDEHSHSL